MRPPEGMPGRDTTDCLTGRVVSLFGNTDPSDYRKISYEKSEYPEIYDICRLRKGDRWRPWIGTFTVPSPVNSDTAPTFHTAVLALCGWASLSIIHCVANFTVGDD